MSSPACPSPHAAAARSFAPPLDAAVEAAVGKLRRTSRDLGIHYPDDTTLEDRYEPRVRRADLPDLPEGANHGWTTGFWPGQLWLAYELSGDPEFRERALVHVESFASRVENEVDIDTHDLGFLYTPSCVVAWRACGDERARSAALTAADHLMRRFLEPAGIIQAWGDLSDPVQRGRTIIDSLLNTPLLLWAARERGRSDLRDAARRHVTALQNDIVRPDGSTFHTFHWDVDDGRPLRGSTHQGHSDDSCWARGQAWGILGFAINAGLQDEPAFLATAIRCAEYFLAHQGPARVATWDLALAAGAEHPLDSSASAIAACGLLEIASQDHNAARAARYRSEANAIAAALISKCTAGASDALLRHGVYNHNRGAGVDEGNLWGDYFYLEALQRLRNPAWLPYW